MGFIGKIFVLLTGFASIFFLIIAASIYTQKPKWFVEKQIGGNAGDIGRVDFIDQMIKVYNEADKRAGQRWETNRSPISKLESQRLERRDFYQDQLTRVRTGKTKDGKMISAPIVLQMEVDPNNEPFFTLSPNKPIKVGVENLDCIANYNRKISDTYAAIRTKQDTITKLIKDYGDLTTQIFGTKDIKGLRTFIKEHEIILDNTINGTKHLAPILTDRETEKLIFTRRNTLLLGRIRELEQAIKQSTTGTGK